MVISDKFLGWIGRKIMAATQRGHTGWFTDWAQGGRSTLSGETVSNDNAYQLSTVFACIRAISEDIGKLPLKLYKNVSPRGKQPLPNNRIYKLLHDQPNPEMTAMTFRQVLTAHALGWGNGYANIERAIDGSVLWLWPLRPDRIRVYRLEDGRIWYEIRTDDDKIGWLRDDNVLHIHGLGFDGLIGYNVIRYARECLGAAVAVQKYAASLYGNSVCAAGILTHPASLKKEAQDRLRKSFEKYRGAKNAHRLMILEEGMSFTQTSIPPEEAQFLETRQFGVPEICRWFRMPPHKVADLSRATFSNIEHQALEYVGDTLMPWFVRWEQEIWRKLLSDEEKAKGMFVRHVAQGLLRGDISTRYQAYQTGRNWGWLSADDVRELEDMNPLPDEQGEKYLIPLNMKDAAEPEAEVIVDTKPDTEEVFGAIVLDAAERVASAEAREIGKVAARAQEDYEKFNNWVTNFFNNHAGYIRQVLELVSAAWSEYADTKFCLAVIVDQLVTEGAAAFTQGDPEIVLESWRAERIKRIVDIIRGAKNAIAKTQEK